MLELSHLAGNLCALLFGNEYTNFDSNYQISGELDGVLHLQTAQDRGLVVLLTSAKLLNNTCFLKLPLELLESSFDVLTIFNRYDNHALFLNVNLLDIMLLAGIAHNLRVQNYSYLLRMTTFTRFF